MKEIDRRGFIATALLGMGVGLAACGKKTRGITGISGKNNIPTPDELNIALTTNDLLENSTGRVGFVLRKGEQTLVPKTLEVAIDSDSNGAFKTKIDATTYTDTAGGAPYSVFTHAFGARGTYFTRVKSEFGTVTGAINVIPANTTSVPKTGEKLISTDSPTNKNPLGTNPVCTRKPPCPLHDVSIPDALALKRPIALLFATPALCTSATCGPVLDVILNVKDQFSAVTFIHVEIYKDNTGTDYVDAVSKYNLTTEPELFLADSTGKIVNRIDGLFGETEAKAELSKLS